MGRNPFPEYAFLTEIELPEIIQSPAAAVSPEREHLAPHNEDTKGNVLRTIASESLGAAAPIERDVPTSSLTEWRLSKPQVVQMSRLACLLYTLCRYFCPFLSFTTSPYCRRPPMQPHSGVREVLENETSLFGRPKRSTQGGWPPPCAMMVLYRLLHV